jgi:hypothetical protein
MRFPVLNPLTSVQIDMAVQNEFIARITKEEAKNNRKYLTY